MAILMGDFASHQNLANARVSSNSRVRPGGIFGRTSASGNTPKGMLGTDFRSSCLVDVGRLRALLTLNDLEFDPVAFL
jgi:hypothetical protein